MFSHLSILQCLMSNQWPVKRTRSAFSVSLMYWMAHCLHSFKYTMLLVPQSAVAFTPNRVLVVVLLNMVPVFICRHDLQRGCLHELFPLYVSLCCINVTLTKRSLRLGGQRYATMGHFGSASFKWGDISMTHWWLWRMCIRWGRFGWNVTTSRVTCSLSFLDCGVNSSSRDILVAFSIPRCTCILSPSWPRIIKCLLSSATLCW